MDDGGWGSANPIFLGYIAGLAVLAILFAPDDVRPAKAGADYQQDENGDVVGLADQGEQCFHLQTLPMAVISSTASLAALRAINTSRSVISISLVPACRWRGGASSGVGRQRLNRAVAENDFQVTIRRIDV